MGNILKEKLASGVKLTGTEIDLCDPCVSEMIGQLGYDAVWIDTEHQALDYHAVLMHIIAAKAAGTASVVRIPQNEPFLAKRILEMGPDGIIFPQINNAKELKKAMDACLYPPLGKRGYGPQRAVRYGAMDLDEYVATATERFCRFAQIESAEAVADLNAMLEIPFVDGFIIGPNDLSGSIGRLHDIFHPEVLALIDETIAKCRAKNVPIGIAVGAATEDDFRFWYDRGLQIVFSGTDIFTLTEAAGIRLERMKRAIQKQYR